MAIGRPAQSFFGSPIISSDLAAKITCLGLHQLSSCFMAKASIIITILQGG